ncbi:MAG: GNAT family N-acetyltransferase [Halobacteriovoraceae bacterium]|nr:GNAT family N-acetyltransferase [Halobacteriovoraceae bacterium]MCB9094136.1 GNAT family N-acetyltransferase [Halobacteriovoraceae bacterium]
MKEKRSKLKLYFYKNPRESLSKERFLHLRRKLKEVAYECFEDIPDYQIFSDNQHEDCENIVVTAYYKGEIVGFTSALILKVYEDQNVLHLGLTCVKSGYRGLKISQKLMKKMITNYWVRYSLFDRIWISNVACVLSSLGNVAKNFSQIFPSPRFPVCPTLDHLLISTAIARKFRNELYIPWESQFDHDSNVFYNSVENTMFEKTEDDQRFHHRSHLYNDYYKKLINFQRGDEVLQIGWVNTWHILTHALRGWLKKNRLKSKRVTNEVESY